MSEIDEAREYLAAYFTNRTVVHLETLIRATLSARQPTPDAERPATIDMTLYGPGVKERPAEKCGNPLCPKHGAAPSRSPYAECVGSGSAPRETCPTCGGSTTLGVCTYWRCFDARKAASAASERTHGEAKEAVGGAGEIRSVARPESEEGSRVSGQDERAGAPEVARPTSSGVPDAQKILVLEAEDIAEAKAEGKPCWFPTSERDGDFLVDAWLRGRDYRPPQAMSGYRYRVVTYARIEPTPAPAEAASEGCELHFCDYDTGPHICDDRCDGHTVKEMEAYDAGRASLAKRIEELEQERKDILGIDAARCDVVRSLQAEVAELKRELSAGGTKEAK